MIAIKSNGKLIMIREKRGDKTNGIKRNGPNDLYGYKKEERNKTEGSYRGY